MVTLLFIFTALSSAVSQYILYEEPKTWFEAQTYCRENHLDLATIVNLTQNDLMTTFGIAELAWIGLYDDPTKWMWIKGNTDLNNTGFTNWQSSNPDYYTIHSSEKEICVSMESDGLWNDRNCADKLPRVCYDERYDHEGEPLSWVDSQYDCSHQKKDLTSVRDQIENDAIQQKLYDPSWIGLYRHTWVNWSDSTFSTFSNWDVDMNVKLNTSANFHCAMVNTKTGTWFRASCDLQLPFICNTLQSSPTPSGSTSGEVSSGSGDVVSTGSVEGGTFKSGYTSWIKLSLKTDANLNRVAIQRQVLQQIHAKLGEHVKSDFKLRWTQNDGPSSEEQEKQKDCSYHL